MLKKITAWPVLAFALSAPALMDCSAKDAAEAAAVAAQCGTDPCNELNGGASGIASLKGSVDAKYLATLQAFSDLEALSVAMITDTGSACVAIATDLGATDTWSNKGAPSTPEFVQEACAQAKAKIDAITQAGVSAGCQFNLVFSEPKCSASLDAQASCQGQCQVDASCQPGSVEAQCSGGLYGSCDPVNCQGDVSCVGSATASVDCQGTCDAECTGTCSAACTGTVTGGCDGTCEGKCDGQASNGQAAGACTGTCEGTCSKPAASATCTGSCKASCTGKCTGTCKVDAGVTASCSSSVSCSGGCKGGYTKPQCTGSITPPSCQVDGNCQASCEGSVKATATCDPPSVQFVAACTADVADVDKLVATLETNLPKLLVNFKARGQAVVDLVGTIKGDVEGLVTASASLSGKACACLKASVSAFVDVQANISVSVQASASVSGSAGAQ